MEKNKLYENFSNIKSSFLLIVFILFSTDSMLVSSNSDRLPARLSWILIILFFSFNISRFKLCFKEFFFLYFFSYLIILSSIINDDKLDINYFQRAFILWVAAIIVKTFSYDFFVKGYLSVINFIAAFSLTCWILQGVIINISFIPIIHAGNLDYKTLLFTNIPLISHRNFGPFWEPGAFQLFLNYAIFLQIREKKYFNLKSLVLLSITLFTTFSSSGIIVLGLILLYSLFKESNFDSANFFALKVFIIVLLFIFVIFLIHSDYGKSIFFKIYAYIDNPLDKNSANVSAYTRFNSIGANINLIMQHPLFGWGISKSKEIFLENYNLTSNPNTILGFGSCYGIFAMFLYCFILVKGFLKNTSKNILKIIQLFMFVIMLSVESLLVSLPFYTILFYESGFFTYGYSYKYKMSRFQQNEIHD